MCLQLQNYVFFHRIHLASLHYNENSERMQAVTRDGKPRFTLCFPKSKRGKHTVRAVKTKATYSKNPYLLSMIILLLYYMISAINTKPYSIKFHSSINLYLYFQTMPLTSYI